MGKTFRDNKSESRPDKQKKIVKEKKYGYAKTQYTKHILRPRDYVYEDCD